jgi:predicted small secreted protein
MKKNLSIKILFVAAIALSLASCEKESTTTTATGKDINTAEKVSVDRFSSTAGHLMIRSASNGLPAANAAINFDVAPFITKGLSKSGTTTEYYNFDVQPVIPVPIYVFFKSGATTPLSGQNNVINTIPGETGYNDFWIVNKVTVPDTYVDIIFKRQLLLLIARLYRMAQQLPKNLVVVHKQ